MRLVPLGRRGTAYGIFNAILGFGTLVSGVIFGYFLNEGYSVLILVGFFTAANRRYFNSKP